MLELRFEGHLMLNKKGMRGNTNGISAEALNILRCAMIIAGRLFLLDRKINSEQEGVRAGEVCMVR